MTDESKPPEPGSSPRKAGITRYLAIFVPIFGLAELGAHFYFARRAPNTEEWAAVRPQVAAVYQPNNVVVVAPYWAEPMARLAFGDALMPLRDVARPDVTRYPQAVEVSILGQRAPELAGWKVLREEKEGRFAIRTLGNPAPTSVKFDFTDHVDSASAAVRIERKGLSPVDCTFTTTAMVESGGLGGPPVYPASRFMCPGEPTHVFVGVTIIDDEQMHPRRCIWSHSPGADAELITRFHDVPLGSLIHGHVGMGWHTERDRAVPPFTVRITVDGQEVGKVVHDPGDFWKSFELSLDAAHANRTADVEFHAGTPFGTTHICYEADSR